MIIKVILSLFILIGGVLAQDTKTWVPSSDDLKQYTPEQIEHIKCSLERKSTPIIGIGKHRPRFLGFVPYGSKKFTRMIDPEDSFGSVLHCFKDVHKRGGGYCQVQTCSLFTSRTRRLDNHLTPDVHLRVKLD